jgi:hypothetical protein
MNTRAIHHPAVAAEFDGLRLRTSLRRVSLVRRFRNLVELSDWDEKILMHSREIDAFCWMLAGGTAALLLPMGFLVMR